MVSFHSHADSLQHILKLSAFSKHACFESCMQHLNGPLFNVEEALIRRCLNSQNITLAANDVNSIQKRRTRINISNKNTC